MVLSSLSFDSGRRFVQPAGKRAQSYVVIIACCFGYRKTQDQRKRLHLRGLSYRAAASAETYPKQKLPERQTFRGVWFSLLYDLGLADAVDVAGEVEHLVGEAPLVVGDPSCLPRSLRSPVPVSAVGMPRFAVSCLCSVFCYGSLVFLVVIVSETKTFFIPDTIQQV